mgnify:CR=1 FL=1
MTDSLLNFIETLFSKYRDQKPELYNQPYYVAWHFINRPIVMEQFDIEDLSVAAVYKSYPDEQRTKLLALRQLIFETADAIDDVTLTETLKWGEPSYNASGKTGTPIRLAPSKEKGLCGLFVHSQTSLIDEFRNKYPDTFYYSGTRAIYFEPDGTLAKPELREFITAALTYHRRKPLSAKN